MRSVLLILALLYGVTLVGQQPETHILEVFKKLEEYRILSMAQDKYGYLWLGTNKGIVRYDGAKNKTIEPGTITQQISKLIADGERLYAGFYNGSLALIDCKTKQLGWVKKISDSEITAIAADAKNRIWVGTASDGLYVLEDEKILHYTTAEGLVDETINDIQITTEHIIIATDLGLSICSAHAPSMVFKNFDTQNGLLDNMALRILPQLSGSVFIGAQSGIIYLFDWQEQKATLLANCPASVVSMHYNQKSLVVISTSGDCFIFDKNNNKNYQQFKLNGTDGIRSSGQISSVILDHENTLVCATGRHTLLVADISTLVIDQHEGLDMRGLHALYCDKAGQIWFSNATGLYSHPGDFAENQHLKCHYRLTEKQTNIVCIHEGVDQDIWFGMFGSGLGRLDLTTGKVQIFNSTNGLPNDNILSITKGEKSIWLATLGGAIEVKKNESSSYTFHKYDIQSELNSNYIYSVLSTGNKLWFGSDGKGLISYDNKQFHQLREQYPEMAKTVISMSPRSQNGVWLLTTDSGLQSFNGKELVQYSLQTENENVELFNLCSDDQGNAFLLTSAGLAKLDLNNTQAAFRPLPQSSHSEYLHTIATDYSGRVWIATDDGLVQMSDQPSARNIPSARIDELLVMLQPTDTAIHHFNHTDQHFTFNFSSVWLTNPDAVKYQYRLIGLDTSWITTRDVFVNFPKLGPGSYQFQLRASENSVFQYSSITSYSFTISKPWWKSFWLITTMITLIIFTGVLFTNRRLKIIQQREQMKTALLQSEFETLKNQINPHFLFNSFNTLIGTIRQDKKLAEQYVEQLSDYFRMILEQRNKNKISLQEELTLLDRYMYLQKQRFAEKLQYENHIGDELLKTEIPPMTLQILAENCIKHNVISNQKPLKITLGATPSHLFIRNNMQPKFSKENSTGIGLNNIVSRYQILFDKHVEIDHTEDTFTVWLPVINPSKREHL